jgi:hypothetical protein
VTFSDCKKSEHEVASGVIKPFAEARDREALAGGASNEKVNCSKIPLLEVGHVTKIGDMRVMVLKHRRRERLNLAEPHRSPTKTVPRNACGFNAATDG